MEPRTLRRSRDRWLLGVCGGLAEHLGWTPARVRGAWGLLSLLTGGFPGVIAYLVLGAVMPPPRRGFRIEDFREQ